MLHAVLGTLEGRCALAARDVSRVFRLLAEHGVTQRALADAIGMSQSQVSEIVHGRAVMQVRVLERIADGLGIDRAWLGVAGCDNYAVGTGSPDEMDEAMKRRAFLAAASAALWGQPVLGELRELGR
jgi:transcriptional regulator with XRE-family HTH domain